ncbi:MAG: SNF2-related protein, partial [Gemmatales bacterium]|nr:SNF2-related protein [Gemmatales bacterium]
QFYDQVLSLNDLHHITVAGQGEYDFSGHGERFFLAIESHRIRAAYQFDPLFAVNISQVDPLPHQIEAVYHYLLRSPRIRFLLADDPGAGKTIMAGLLIKELKYRGLVQRTLIVVPGHLKDQWRREMKERFAETFTVVDRAVMDATWGRNVWQEQPQVITSMDFAKQDDVMAALAE